MFFHFALCPFSVFLFLFSASFAVLFLFCFFLRFSPFSAFFVDLLPFPFFRFPFPSFCSSFFHSFLPSIFLLSLCLFSPFSPVFLHFVLSALIKLLCYCSKDGLPTVLNTSRGVFYGHTYDGWHTWWGILKCHVVFALKYWEKALKY